MALTILTGSSQAAATNYSYTTSGSADWASVPTASYFYDIVDKTVRFKATNSTFSNVATASFALTASNVSGTVTSASFATTASKSTITILGASDTQSFALTMVASNTTTSSNNPASLAIHSYAPLIYSVAGGGPSGQGILQTTASFAQTASYVTASNVVGTVTSASYALSASWAPGGGGTPGGSNQAVQFNNGGTLGGETFFRYDSVKKSISNGINVTASGFYSHAEGYYTIASGTGSHAEGSSTTANGFASHAEGENTQAIGDYSHTEGSSTTAGSNQGYLATTVTAGSCSLDASYGDISAQYTPGNIILLDDTAYDGTYGVQTFIVDSVTWDTTNTIVTLTDATVTTTSGAIIGNITYGIVNWTGGYPIGGQYSHAEGTNNYAIGVASHTEGSDTQAIGAGSHAEGASNKAIGYASHAEGVGTTAQGDYSHAEGDSTQAYGVASHTEGSSTKAGSNQGYVTDVGSSISSGVCILDQSYGDVSAEYNPGDIIVFDDTAYGSTYGVQTFIVASAYWDGKFTIVLLTDTSVNTTTAIIGNITYGIANWAGGYPIGGQYSHAEGYITQAIGDYSHAEGEETQAIGYASHAEGASTQAIGAGSHAEGGSTQAIGPGSHAEGASTQARGQFSHAEGLSTIASGSYQHVSGQFNTHGDTTSLFIVGNGVDNNTRSDAFKVTPSGSIILPNTVNGTPSWTGTQGEMVFYQNAATYRIFVWLDGGWRNVNLS